MIYSDIRYIKRAAVMAGENLTCRSRCVEAAVEVELGAKLAQSRPMQSRGAPKLDDAIDAVLLRHAPSAENHHCRDCRLERATAIAAYSRPSEASIAIMP